MNTFSRIFIFIILSITVVSCTRNDAQEEYERSAYAQAEGFTSTDFNGNIEGSEDEDDWRTSPFYTGLASVEPVFPNPVSYGTTANLDVYLNGASFTSVLELGYLDISGNWVQLQFMEDVTDFSVNTMLINTQLFGSNAEIGRGLYRLILIDGSQRIITYGDIRID
jgi:hypothetical protein